MSAAAALIALHSNTIQLQTVTFNSVYVAQVISPGEKFDSVKRIPTIPGFR